MQVLQAFKNQHNNKKNKLEMFSSDDEDCFDINDEDYDDDDELDFLDDELKQFSMLKQANNGNKIGNTSGNGNSIGANAKKNINQITVNAAQTKVLNGAPNNDAKMGSSDAHFGALNPSALAGLQNLMATIMGVLHKGPNLSTGYPANPNAAVAASGGFGRC